MSTTRDASNLVKLFGMHNLMIETELSAIQNEFDITIKSTSAKKSEQKDDIYYPQFDEKIRKQAAEMARYYEIFYCLELSIRTIIVSKLKDVYKTEWWETCVPQNVKDNAKKAHKNEVQAGITIRSDELIDYTTFGELGEIIKTSWKDFNDIFNDQSALQRVIANLNLLRGPIAHCSPFAEDEKLRLQITIRDWFRLME